MIKIIISIILQRSEHFKILREKVEPRRTSIGAGFWAVFATNVLKVFL